MSLIDLDVGLGGQVLLFLVIGISLLAATAIGFAISVVVLRLRNERKAAHWARLEARWDQAILGVLTGDRASDDFWSLVAPEEELFCVNYVLRFSRRVSGAERTILRGLAAPYLPRIEARLHDRDPQRRARAVQTLGELGLPNYANSVIDALDDPSPIVAMVAARTLARKEHPEYLPSVVARLHRFTTWSRNFLASMLASVGPEAGATLRDVLADTSRSTEVRALVATTLAYLHDLPAADIAATTIATATDRELLAACLRLLERVGRAEHRDPVRLAMESSDFVVRAAAASALGTIGAQDDMARLRAACEDDSRWVAIHAARALRDAGQLEALQQLASTGQDRATLALQVLSEVQGS